MSSSLTHHADPPPPDSLTHEDRPQEPELFGQDRLERHAVTLAGLYGLAPDPVRGRPLLPRLDQSAQELDDAYRFLSTAVTKDAPAVGSEDWLRDNHHVVQDQVREIRQDLPRKYYLELPKLADGPLAGYPRVYAFARELITHTAGRLDLQTLVDFATAYQRAAPLTIGEIWAIPIMLRLGLVEELRRLAADVVSARRSRDRARAWGVQLSAGDQAPERLIEQTLRPRGGSERTIVGGVRRRAAALAPRSALVGGAGVARAAARARRPGRLGRRNAARRAPARSRRAAGDREHHHHDAAAVVDRLAALLRARQPGRAGAARGSRRRLRADGFSDPRPLPPFGRGTGARGSERPSRTSPAPRSTWPPRPARPPPTRIARITSATT